jgi:hypothetical protein
MPYQANAARRHQFSKAQYRVKNWGEYDRALQERGSLTLWVTPEAIAAWHPPPTGRRGRSPLMNVNHKRICQNSFIRGKSLSIEPSLPGTSPLFSGVCKASEIRTQGSPPAEERDLTDPKGGHFHFALTPTLLFY